MLVGRESEFIKLEKLLSTALSAGANDGEGEDGGVAERQLPLSIYISGPPGTGKTVTVEAVVKKLGKTYKFRYVPVNCYSTQTSSSLATELLAKLGQHSDRAPPVGGGRTVNRKLCEVFTNTKKPILILLDEVDNLQNGKSKQLLYTVFGWPTQFDGRVVVIGIANTLDLTERQMPLLKLGSTHPQLITFSAYTSEQLITILDQRFSTSKCFDRKAIELCARKVSALKGDVRLAFDIASQMLTNLEAAAAAAAVADDDDADKENIEQAANADAKALLAASKTAADWEERQQKTPSKCRHGVVGERTPQKKLATAAASSSLLRKGTPTAQTHTTPTRHGRGGGGTTTPNTTAKEGRNNNGGTSSSKKTNEEEEMVVVTPKRTKFEEGGACREVLKAINKTMASPCQRARLPVQTRTLLATLMRLISLSSVSAAASRCSSTPLRSLLFMTPSKTMPRGGGATTKKAATPYNSTITASSSSLSVTRERLFSAYLTVCERLKLATPCPEEVDEMLTLLESQSMVTLQTARTGGHGRGAPSGGQSRVCFTVEMSIARAQINDNALINDIEQIEL